MAECGARAGRRFNPLVPARNARGLRVIHRHGDQIDAADLSAFSKPRNLAPKLRRAAHLS